jgi:hypothetical protein
MRFSTLSVDERWKAESTRAETGTSTRCTAELVPSSGRDKWIFLQASGDRVGDRIGAEVYIKEKFLQMRIDIPRGRQS